MSSRYDELLQVIRSSAGQQNQQLLVELSDTLRSIIFALADEQIKSSMARGQYKKALLLDLVKNHSRVGLDDGARWALRLEQGGPRLDMRDYMLKGRTYRNVPMDRSVGSAKTYAETSANSPWTASSIKDFLDHKIRTMATVRAADGTARLQATNEGRRMPAGAVVKIKPEHVADPFARMVKLQQTYAKATQTTGFRIWRRISEEGRGTTWMQPEQKALNILSAAVKHEAWQKGVQLYTGKLEDIIVGALTEALNG